MPIINMVYKKQPKWNWDLSKVSDNTRTYIQQSFWNNRYWYSLQFSEDWTKMFYAVSQYPSWWVYRYDLSTPRDITTVWTATQSYNTIGSEYPSFCFGNNWNVFAIRTSNKYITLYSLSTPYDLTSTFTSIWGLTGADYPSPYCFSGDGSKFIYNDNGNSKIYQYSASTPFTIGSGSPILTVTSYWWNNLYSIDWEYFYIGNSSKEIIKYKLSTKWDISTATEAQRVTLTIWQNITWLSFDTNWNNMFVLGQANNTQYLYKYPLI